MELKHTQRETHTFLKTLKKIYGNDLQPGRDEWDAWINLSMYMSWNTQFRGKTKLKEDLWYCSYSLSLKICFLCSNTDFSVHVHACINFNSASPAPVPSYLIFTHKKKEIPPCVVLLLGCVSFVFLPCHSCTRLQYFCKIQAPTPIHSHLHILYCLSCGNRFLFTHTLFQLQTGDRNKKCSFARVVTHHH